MTWNIVQPSQVSTMLSKVLYYNIDSVLLWKALYAPGKSYLEAVGTQLSSQYLALSIDSNRSVHAPPQ